MATYNRKDFNPDYAGTLNKKGLFDAQGRLIAISFMEPKIPVETIEERSKLAAELLKALANDKRLMILCKLKDGEKSVSELLEYVDLSQSALSQHLTFLKEKGLVKRDKRGQQVFYSVGSPSVIAVMKTLSEIYTDREFG